MIKGGYKIIDLQGQNISKDTTATVDGVYELLEANYRKPVLLSGLVVDGVERDDVFVAAQMSGTNYVIEGLYGNRVTIAEDDSISATATPALDLASVTRTINYVYTNEQSIADPAVGETSTAEGVQWQLTQQSSFSVWYNGGDQTSGIYCGVINRLVIGANTYNRIPCSVLTVTGNVLAVAFTVPAPDDSDGYTAHTYVAYATQGSSVTLTLKKIS